MCRTAGYRNSKSSENLLVLIQLGAVHKDSTGLLAYGSDFQPVFRERLSGVLQEI